MAQTSLEKYLDKNFYGMPMTTQTLYGLAQAVLEFCHKENLPNQVVIADLNGTSVRVYPESVQPNGGIDLFNSINADELFELGNKQVKLVIHK